MTTQQDDSTTKEKANMLLRSRESQKRKHEWKQQTKTSTPKNSPSILNVGHLLKISGSE